MESPQLENGYTAIAHEILEKLCQLPLNGTQYRIIMVVWRYTYGFQRKEHKLSESFISKATGVHKKQVQRELGELINYGLITVVGEATFKSPRILQFNKHHESWEVTKKIPGNKNVPHTGSELVTSPGSGLAPQENNIYKTNIKTIKEDEEARAHEGEVFKFYQNNIGLLVQHQRELIGSYFDDGVTPEMLIEVVKDSLGKHDSWSWIKKVVQNCIESNVKTLEQYNAKKVERENAAKSRDAPKSKGQGIPQRGNFQQRQYEDSYFDSLYDNVGGGKDDGG